MTTSTFTEQIKLIQPLLGLKPYVLIEADSDPADGELVLSVNAGGGAQERIEALPFLFISNLPADRNPLTLAIAEYLDEHPSGRDAIEKFAELIDVPMPEEGA